MDHFTYRHGTLHAEGVPLADIAAAVGTPTYVYSTATLTRHATLLQDAFAPLRPLICFAVKSCPNIHILRHLVSLGLGMDVVSAGELTRALAAGCDPAKIVFAGVGKARAEIDLALSTRPAPVGQFNVESAQELEAIAASASALGVTARVALRVNPMVAAGGHAHIQTATPTSKFGLSIDQARALARAYSPNHADHTAGHVRIAGLHMHLGSSIVTPQPYLLAIPRLLALADELADMGHTIDTLDLGGGFGADYNTGDAPAPTAFAHAIIPLLQARVNVGLKVVIEPGRFIAANAGILLTRVLYVKHDQGTGRTFIVCDAGMNTLLRPALYDAFHFLWPARVPPELVPLTRGHTPTFATTTAQSLAHAPHPQLTTVDVVGPICESADVLAKARPLPPIAQGDLLSLFAAGAYGMSMASRYNSHPLPAEVLVNDRAFTTIRRRETLDDLLAHERD